MHVESYIDEAHGVVGQIQKQIKEGETHSRWLQLIPCRMCEPKMSARHRKMRKLMVQLIQLGHWVESKMEHLEFIAAKQ